MKVLFTVVEGPHAGQAFAFEGHEMFVVGRSRRAHFRLPAKDEFFSRLHFLVEVNPPRCRLLDMGSTNGTHVNGQRVAAADLGDGDRIQAGQTVLRVSLVDDESEVPTRVGAGPAPSGTDRPDGETVSRPGPHLPRALVSTDLTPVDGLACRVCRAVAGEELAPADRPAAGWGVCRRCRDDLAGQVQAIPGYWVVRDLGRGGMGLVSLALRERDGMVVALKRILPTADTTRVQLERFLREADTLRQLAHPAIIAFRDVGQADDQLYLAMEYVAGADAERLLGGRTDLPIARAVGLARPLLEALAFAHERGFVHRDVKPANLLVRGAGGPPPVKLADFGLARIYQQSQLSGLTLAGDVGGTLRYMAPEQFLNFRDARPAADQYSAAATLYHLLTGRFVHDFPPDFQQRVRLLLEADPVPIRHRRPEIPAGLAGAIHRALHKEPEGRFPSCRDFAEALAPFAG